jgi:hypothetical protein
VLFFYPPTDLTHQTKYSQEVAAIKASVENIMGMTLYSRYLELRKISHL